MRVRPGDTFREPDASAAYAEKLHRVLLEQGVEHIVVTYQFHYYTNHYEEALSTRTAVVYRDEVNPRYPWWLKDDRLFTPLWLPNGDLAHQISFYAQRPAEVIEKHVYPAHGKGGKATVTLLRPPQAHLRAENLQKPQPVTRVTQVKAAPISPAKSAVSVHPTEVKPVADATRRAAVTRIQQSSPKVASRAEAPTAVSNESAGSNPAVIPWSPPVQLNPSTQSSANGSESGAQDAHLEKLFRAHNGTNYDPTSAVDRRKMEKIKRGVVERDPTGARGSRRGAEGAKF
jgi:hypothetical protein